MFLVLLSRADGDISGALRFDKEGPARKAMELYKLPRWLVRADLYRKASDDSSADLLHVAFSERLGA